MPYMNETQIKAASMLIDFGLDALEPVARLGLIHANPKWKAAVELITALVEEADRDDPQPPFDAQERFEFVQFRKFLALVPAIETFMTAADAVVLKFARDTLEQLTHMRDTLLAQGRAADALRVSVQLELVRHVVEKGAATPAPSATE